eukprot:scaffold4291_cov76-Skeletonema_dohrnii-CCMP3373.AAC.1
MANYYGSLEAVDCHLHSVRYDMVLERVELAAVSDASSGHLRRCSDADTTNKCLSRVKDASILSWPTIGSLEAVDCRIHSVRYDMVLES